MLYEFCIQIEYIIFVMCTFCRSELMYTKCIHNVCIQNVSHILRNFCRHFVQKISCHSSFNFVNKMYTKVCRNVYILYTFCINQLHTSCIIFVHKMCTQFPCKTPQNFCLAFIDELEKQLY